MCGHTKIDMIKHDCIQEEISMLFEQKMIENQLRWFRHVQRRPPESTPMRRVN